MRVEKDVFRFLLIHYYYLYIDSINLLNYTASHYWQYKETKLIMNEYKRISKSIDEKIELDVDDLSIYKDK